MKNPFGGKTAVGRTNRYVALACLLFVLEVLLSAIGHAASPPVTAGYREAGGTRLTVEIHVGSPPPSSLILVQRLPPGVRLLSAAPAANNVNTDKGEVKWLLHTISPGSQLVEMTLDRAVSADEISAEIRFKPLDGGGMVTLPVAKP